MKIIAIADIHGRSGLGKSVAAAVSSADAVVAAGDITNFGGAEDAGRMIDELQQLNENLLAVPGNCDLPEVNGLLEARNISLHRMRKRCGPAAFYGIGGSIRTPAGTLQEFPEDEFAAALGDFEKDPSCRHHVLVCHQPPLRTNADRIVPGAHVGSRAIRAFIEEFQPDLCVCGHIHEARSSDRIGRTVVINPGPFPAHYAEITLGGEIVFKLY